MTLCNGTAGAIQLTKLKSIAAVCALAIASLAAAPSHAWTLIDWSGSPTGSVWGAPWTASLNTVANSPLRWSPDEENLWFRVYFEGRTDGYADGLPGLAADVRFELEDVSDAGKTWTFSYEVHNASNALNGNQVLASRVSSFSFDVNPDETSASALPGGFFTTLARDVSMNAGAAVGVQDICVKSGQVNNCNGGGGTGVALGQTGVGAFVLNFATAPGELVFTDPAVRFQSLDYRRPDGSVVSGASGTGFAVAWVPEPASWALMILGFAAAGAMLRRRRALAAV
jgi:hypothetical protein